MRYKPLNRYWNHTKGLAFLRMPGENCVKIAIESKGSKCFSMRSFDKTRCISFYFDDFLKITPEQIDEQITGINIPLRGMQDLRQTKRAFYEDLVSLALLKIERNDFRKVVLARNKLVENTKSSLPWSFFKKLCCNMSNALVYFVYHPKLGSWIGATPELLIKYKDQKMQTVALAGTLKDDKENWSKKESEEQAWVSRYIVSQIEGLGGVLLDETSVDSVSYSNLKHLETRFSFALPSGFSLKSLEVLYPTPAVCGYPLGESFSFIKQNESLERFYYSGYLGWEEQGQINYYVNLRCCEIFKNQFVFYAGAGIVDQSIPKAEWDETESKIESTLQFLY